VADAPPQVEWFANLSWQTQHRRAAALGEEAVNSIRQAWDQSQQMIRVQE
jgi:hypothetical protein